MRTLLCYVNPYLSELLHSLNLIAYHHVRLVLIMIIVAYKRGILLTEHPSGSVMERHPRFRWFCDYVLRLYFVRLHTGAFGAATAKLHIFYSNHAGFLDALWRPLPPAFIATRKITTTSVEVTSLGVRKTVAGNKHLKNTQCLPRLAGSCCELSVVYLDSYI